MHPCFLPDGANGHQGRPYPVPILSGAPTDDSLLLINCESWAGVTFPGLSFPCCKRRCLHTYLLGDPMQSTRSPCSSLLPPVLVCREHLLPGASAGGSSLVQVNLPACIPRAGGVEQPPRGAQCACGFWLQASACSRSLFSFLIGCPPWPLRSSVNGSCPCKALEEAHHSLPSAVLQRRGENPREVLGSRECGQSASPGHV